MTEKPEPKPISVRMRVYGEVQGVYYRGWTVEAAAHFGVRGWVRNRKDGSVEIHAEGPAPVIERFYFSCHKGPPLALVESIERADSESESPTGFEQRATV
ncbi:MAG: acylphosphatase [Alphaproteobacteria bacterium]|nr:acylphosphatase [Alphaproteobacteria bacterium]